MIIGIDGSRSFVEGKTGTENYSYQILRNLSLVDSKNQYLVYLRPGQTQGGDWPDNFKFRVLNFKFLWTQVGLAKATFEDKLDVLFVPSHTLPLIRKPGLKTVITVHDLGAQYLPGMHQLKQLIYLSLITNYQLHTASKVIAVSNSTKKDLIKQTGINSDKIKVIYEAVNISIFKQIQKDILKNTLDKYNLEFGNYFLFVGTIQPRKNLIRLISAFKEFLVQKKSLISNHKSVFKLVLVGQNGWKSDQIYKLPSQLGIEKNVCFLPAKEAKDGRVSDQNLAILYNGARALTYPSLFEGFGLPILEAMACGCPVITSDVSSMPEVAGEGAVLIDPLSVTEITDAMIELAKNDVLVNSLIIKGNIQLKKFSWKKAALETLRVLEEAVE